MEYTFKAGVQYGDLYGSVAADRHDKEDLSNYLRDKKLITNDEFIAGIELSVGEIHKPLRDEDGIYIYVFIFNKQGFDNFDEALKSGEVLTLRKIELKMPPKDFLSFFKRFNITLSPYGKLEGRDIHLLED